MRQVSRIVVDNFLTELTVCWQNKSYSIEGLTRVEILR